MNDELYHDTNCGDWDERSERHNDTGSLMFIGLHSFLVRVRWFADEQDERGGRGKDGMG